MPENTLTQPKEKIQERVVVMNGIDNQTVVEANALIRAAAHMDTAPLKLFEIAVSGLDSKSEDPATTVKIKKQAIFKAFDVQGKNRNAQLTALAEKLRHDADFQITVVDEHGTQDVGISPVSYTKNSHNNDYIVIGFTPQIMPYVSALKKCFTQYQLADVLKLKSRYAIVLYRWLMMSWRQYEHYVGTKERTPQQLVDYQNPRASLDELHRLTGTTKKYRDFRNFRKNVLDAAVDEINSKTGYAIAYEKASSGRRVTGIIFHITDKRAPEPQPQSTAPEPAPQANPQIATQLFASPYTGMLMTAGLTDPVALTGDASYQRGLLERLYPAYDRFVGRFGQSALERHIKYVGAHTAQKPDNLVPYMLKVLADYESQLEQASQKPGKRVKSGRAQINEELPEWAVHPENVKAKKPSPEKLAKIDRMLAELEKDKNRQSDQEGAHR